MLTPFISLCREPSRSGVYVYPVASPSIPFDLCLVYDKRRQPNAAARHFIAAIEAEFRIVDSIWREIGATQE